ncbi:MAG: HAMP domain-containing sensor histidine kinase [Gemmataceae bacterium]|nr:HAMP domain-containing histidine kinase [Gemmata sp.]MDW8198507.1 HAMP domain-containing sensor histidine kinase [Gemmataceae bacterium]
MIGVILSLAFFYADGQRAATKLTTTRAVRELTHNEAQSGHPVHLYGVVTFTTNPPDAFYLQDDTGGIRVVWHDSNRVLRPGMTVRVRGATTAGKFLPEILAAPNGVQLDPRTLAVQPRSFNLTREEAYYLDAQYVEAEAVVQRAWVHEPWLKLDLARGHGQIVAYVPKPLGVTIKRAMGLRGAVVRVRGVWQRTNDPKDPSRLLVNTVDAFEVLQQPDPPQERPLVTAAELNRFCSDPIRCRLPVRVSGIVTMNQIRSMLYVQDATGVAHLYFAEPVHEIATGQVITVLGFPRAAGTSDPPRVENCTLLDRQPTVSTGELPLPEPLAATAAEAASGKLDGRIIRLTGIVHSFTRREKWPTYTLLVDDLTCTVILLGDAQEVPIGSTVEVVGAVTRQPFPNFPRYPFAIFARVNDVKVLTGPPQPVVVTTWWTGPRVAYLTAGLLGLVLLAGATATVLRMQARRAAALAQRREAENALLESQLQQAARLGEVGQVASGVAHDFNNLLTIINGCSQMMSEVMTDDPRRAASLAHEITRTVQHASSLIRLLMNVSRQKQFEPQLVNLNSVVADTAALLARVMSEKVSVRVITDPNLPLVVADTAWLLQIILNLAVNARDAMPQGGTFTLTTCSPEPGVVRLIATDTGVGMTDEVKAHIFERGFTTKGEAKGTGLGLATVKDVVTRLGGQIRFRSEVGRGTEFEIDLPAAPVSRALSLAG